MIYPQNQYEIRRSPLGCMIRPYTRTQSKEIERGTYTYDSVYRRKVPYVGFTVPVRGMPTYLTYNRNYDELVRFFPTHPIDNIPIIRGETVQSNFQIIGIESFRPAQTEILSEIDRLRTQKGQNIWFVNLQTNEGKTILSVYLSTILKQKTMVLCYSKDILSQWKDTFLNKTNLEPERLIELSGPILTKFLAGKLNYQDYDIYLATPELLDRYAATRHDYGVIEDIFNTLKIGFMIYDEAHRNVGELVKIVSLTNVRYQIYLSADYAQGGYEREKMFYKVFQDVPVITPSDKLKRSLKYTRIMVFKFNTYPNSIEENEPFGKYGFNASLYMKYEFKKGFIQSGIKYLIQKFMVDNPNHNKHRMLILFTNVEHVVEMTDILRHEKKFRNFMIGEYHSSLNDEQKRFSKNRADIIVATYASFGTGLDTTNIKYVVSCNLCNKVQDNQAAGRARRLPDGSNALYIMMTDEGFPYCKRKTRQRLAYLQETKSKDETVHSFVFNPQIHDINLGENDERKQISADTNDSN